ncbi:MAG: 4'-phosphopantetheinyl transferase superfamily protein [Clostridia bacterium]|nr:4'-phosphopantetheinyl transferase superfamily protein [Clostridia bacterium]
MRESYSENVCEITWMDVAPLEDPGLFSRWLGRMPETRRENIISLGAADIRRMSLGVGILLVLALEKRGIEGSGVNIAEGKYGQPWLPDHPNLHFSLSHGGNRALCAICGCPVGCDVESFGRGNRRLVGRFFHPEEQEALGRETDPEAWDRLFTRIWTRKESYLKATGRGLSLPMSSFSVLSPEPGVRYEDRLLPGKQSASCCVFSGERVVFDWKAADVFRKG